MAETKLDWPKLLDEALTAPGNLGDTYSRFYDYSLTNTLLFRMQGLHEPVAAYARWKQLGRQVKRGARAKEVIVPVMINVEQDTGDEKKERVARLIGFKAVRAVFGYSDTEGAEIPPRPTPGWDLQTAHVPHERLTIFGE
jgi:N-terminal domain of anti-restriction factor ArdC